MKPDTGRTFCLEEEVKNIKDHMMTFEEFKGILKKCVYDSLSGVPRESVDRYLKQEGFRIPDVRERYDVGVKDYVKLAAEGETHCNMAFYSELARLDNLLTLCW